MIDYFPYVVKYKFKQNFRFLYLIIKKIRLIPAPVSPLSPANAKSWKQSIGVWRLWLDELAGVSLARARPGIPAIAVGQLPARDFAVVNALPRTLPQPHHNYLSYSPILPAPAPFLQDSKHATAQPTNAR